MGAGPTRSPIASSTSAASSTQERRNWASLRRSEEHTSELQSRSDLVCRLLLEKKKQQIFAGLLVAHKPSSRLLRLAFIPFLFRVHPLHSRAPRQRSLAVCRLSFPSIQVRPAQS